jgi:O-antigen/teichoic acid export membrane protein
VLAKLGSAADVGLYALGMAVSAPVVLFANLQLRTLLASDVRNQFRLGQYLVFRFASLGAALLVVSALAAFTVPDRSRGPVIVLVGFAQSLEYVSDLYYGLMQRSGRMDRLSCSLIFKGPLSLAALALVMYITRNVAWAVMALALGRLFILLAWDARLSYAKTLLGAGGCRLEWDAGNMAHMLRSAAPLGLISMLVALSVNVPRYFIEAHLGATELGIFSAVASLLTAGTLVMSAFGQSIMVPAAKACAHGDRTQFRAWVIQTAMLGLLLGIGGTLSAALFGRYLLTRLFRPEYAAQTDILVLLMAAGMMLFPLGGLGYVITAARELLPQIPALVANCLSAALVSVWAIPRYGLKGAVAAILAGGLVQLAGSLMILRKIDQSLAAVR